MKTDFIKGFVLSLLSLPIIYLLSGIKFPNEMLGLLGVFAGALISYFSVKETLKHTSVENRVQRSIEIKKTVYFEALESIARMRAMLSNISKVDLNKIDPDINMINGLQKIDLIANIELIKQLMSCANYYQIALSEMVYDKIIIEELDSNAKFSLDRHSQYSEQILRTNNTNFKDLINTKMTDCLKYHDRIIKSTLQKRIDLIEKSVHHSCEFDLLLADCVPHLRKDIENSFNAKDTESYKHLVIELNKKNRKTGEEFLQRIREKSEEFKLPNL